MKTTEEPKTMLHIVSIPKQQICFFFQAPQYRNISTLSIRDRLLEAQAPCPNIMGTVIEQEWYQLAEVSSAELFRNVVSFGGRNKGI